ncbi:MAG: replication-associated recombination protein A [Abditibacteriota bacterium]|nr:replication-associated recombination protein A [Abditibacteriota bacterium]
MTDLFDGGAPDAPLAARMRPQKLEDFVGQKEIIAEGTLLRRLIETDNISSFVFWGPPGCGKSTLAGIIAQSTSADFVSFSAVTGGVPELRKIMDRAKDERRYKERRTILFVDEIHRFNKAQQDALLPFVEDGTVILIGATTENPYFEVNTPLLSRSRVVRFSPLSPEDIGSIIRRALAESPELKDMVLEPEALEHIIRISDGDARSALNILELCADLAGDGKTITAALAESAAGEKILGYDKQGEVHYDTISAFIKSMRGSDPDAVLYYLAVMLSAGEDIRFIARRIVICASEDVGNADPMALVIANSAAQAVMQIGIPEARIILAQAAVYVACAPKSNAAYLGIDAALADVTAKEKAPVPMNLRNPAFRDAKKLGYGEGYKYPHDYPGGWVEQDYLPAELEGTEYYRPKDIGYEARFRERLDYMRAQRNKARNKK